MARTQNSEGYLFLCDQGTLAEQCALVKLRNKVFQNAEEMTGSANRLLKITNIRAYLETGT